MCTWLVGLLCVWGFEDTECACACELPFRGLHVSCGVRVGLSPRTFVTAYVHVHIKD